MEVIYTEKVEIAGESQVSLARNKAASLTQKLGFSETEVGRAALITVELAKNIIKHSGTGGALLFRPLSNDGANGIEIIALDKGYGMENAAKCFEDGFSTAGSMGIGLGSVIRLSDYHSVYTEAGNGTVFLSQIWAKSSSAKQKPSFSIGAVCLAKPREQDCGDAWAVSASKDNLTLLVSDGLGHGPEACRSSLEAVRVFNKALIRDPLPLLKAIHASLRPTRGAAAAIVNILPRDGKLTFCGVGNVSGAIAISKGKRHLLSHNGTLGHTVYKFQEISYPWPEDGLLILHSDGLLTSWNLEKYRGIMAKHPSVIAGLLYRDYFRGSDDVTVVVIKP